MKISVVTVCLNAQSLIEQTIRSVLSQTDADLEHIIIDGHSTDRTMDVVNRYRSRLATIVSQPDGGIYDAMNKGIGLSRGDAIGFLNAGDYFADDGVIDRIARALSSADCCYGDLEFYDPIDPVKTVRKWKSQPYEHSLFVKGWHPPHPTFFAKKKLFEQYGVFDTNYNISADYDLMLRFLKKNNVSSTYIPHVLVRMRNGGVSNRNLKQIVKANIECLGAWKKYGLKANPMIIVRKLAYKVKQCV